MSVYRTKQERLKESEELLLKIQEDLAQAKIMAEETQDKRSATICKKIAKQEEEAKMLISRFKAIMEASY